MDWRELVTTEARTWLGTPYHHKGRIKGVGADCGGFIYQVFKTTINVPHESFPDTYAQDWALHKDDNEIYLAFLQPYVLKVASPSPGDIVMFRFGRAFSHGTIFLGDGHYIHAYGKTGSGVVKTSTKKQFNLGQKMRPSVAFTLDTKWLQ